MPQHRDILQAEEMLAITLFGKEYDILWDLKQFEHYGQDHAKREEHEVLSTRSWCQLPGHALHPAVPSWALGIWGRGPCGHQAASIKPHRRLYDHAVPVFRQLQTWLVAQPGHLWPGTDDLEGAQHNITCNVPRQPRKSPYHFL